MALMAFDWFLERLDVARWESETPGSRSAFVNCPVHGGSDSLHLTERKGKALVKCFACDASAGKVQEALESETPTKPNGASHGGARKTSETRKATLSRGVRLPAASTIDPIEWLAERCNLSVTELDALNLPLARAEDHVGFDFPGIDALKIRSATEGKKSEKGFQWIGTATPWFWPMPENPGPDIVVCEGEADAICLRHSGYEETYSITKGANTPIPSYVWDALATKGVENVTLVFDLDDAGRKGREIAADGARAAGMIVREARVQGIRPLESEKDVRDVVKRQGYPLLLEPDADEDDPVVLSSIEAVEPEPLLLDRLHATEHTILFGDGGAGKGVIASWWIARLTREGARILIIDYEYHANLEWRPRVEGFGGNMDLVSILQPTKPIWEIASWLRDKAQAFDYVVIDSVSYACVGEEVEKSVTATKYTMAINIIARPILSIAHVTKENPDPNHPFGSIFWSNGARQTIAVGREKMDDPESTRVIRNPKTNQRGAFQPVGIDWTWLYEQGPPGCDGGPRCPGTPTDQIGMPRHLHESALKQHVTTVVKDIIERERAKGNDPSGPEVHAIVVAENGPDFASIGWVKKEVSILKKKMLAPVNRVPSIDRDSDG